MKWFKDLFSTPAHAPAAGPSTAADDRPPTAAPEPARQPPADGPAATAATPAIPAIPAILATLKEFLAANMTPATRVPAAAIPDDAHVLDGGYVDSVSAADLLVFVKKRFGVRLTEIDLAGGLGQLAKLAGHLAKERHP